MNFQPVDPCITRDFNVWVLTIQEGYTKADALRAVIWDELMQAWGKRQCKKLGTHNFDCEGSASPEGGYEAFSCRRCGHSIFHRYY